MRHFFQRARLVVAPLLTGVVLATTVAVPLLDRDYASSSPGLETKHHPGVCHMGHDHRICVQVQANLALATARELPDLTSHVFRVPPVPAARSVHAVPAVFTYSSRAPPAA